MSEVYQGADMAGAAPVGARPTPNGQDNMRRMLLGRALAGQQQNPQAFAGSRNGSIAGGIGNGVMNAMQMWNMMRGQQPRTGGQLPMPAAQPQGMPVDPAAGGRMPGQY